MIHAVGAFVGSLPDQVREEFQQLTMGSESPGVFRRNEYGGFQQIQRSWIKKASRRGVREFPDIGRHAPREEKSAI